MIRGALVVARKDVAEWRRSRFLAIMVLLGFVNVVAAFALDLRPQLCSVAVVAPASARAEAVYERIAALGHPLRRVSSAAAAATLLERGEVVASVDGSGDAIRLAAARSTAGDLAVDSVRLAAGLELGARNRDALEARGLPVPRVPVSVAPLRPGIRSRDETPVRFYIELCWVSGFLGAVIGILADSDVLARLVRTYGPVELVVGRALAWTALGAPIALAGVAALASGGAVLRSYPAAVLLGVAACASAVPPGVLVALLARGLSSERAHIVIGGLYVALNAYFLALLLAGQEQGGSLVPQAAWLRPLSAHLPVRFVVDLARLGLLGGAAPSGGALARAAVGLAAWALATGAASCVYLRRAAWSGA